MLLFFVFFSASFCLRCSLISLLIPNLIGDEEKRFQGYSSLCHTCEGRYPSLSSLVLHPGMQSLPGYNGSPPHSSPPRHREEAKRRSDFIRVRESPPQSSSPPNATQPRRTGESRYPDLIFKGHSSFKRNFFHRFLRLNRLGKIAPNLFHLFNLL